MWRHPRCGGVRARIERKGSLSANSWPPETADGLLPRFQVNLLDGTAFAYTTDEFEALQEQQRRSAEIRHEETLASIPEDEITPEMQGFHPSRLHFIELYEEEALNALIGKACELRIQVRPTTRLPTACFVEIVEENGQSITLLRRCARSIDFLRE